MKKVLWCVEFWDNGQWDEWAGTRGYHKAWVIGICEGMNRLVTHEVRQKSYGGHRFRVRKVKAT